MTGPGHRATASDHDPETSGVDDMVEEGAPLEPQDFAEVADPEEAETAEGTEEASASSTAEGTEEASASSTAEGTEEASANSTAEVDPLAEAEKALAERTVDLQRLQAEYANYRKRVDRDRELIRENATYAALTPIIEVLDTIDRAREHGELEGGFKEVAEQLERIVADRGLVKFGAEGDVFDPTVHEALSHIGTDPEVTETTCKVIAKAGYKIGDRVVRAAQVLVVDPGEPAEEVVEHE